MNAAIFKIPTNRVIEMAMRINITLSTMANISIAIIENSAYMNGSCVLRKFMFSDGSH
jgi:hypothetical protein